MDELHHFWPYSTIWASSFHFDIGVRMIYSATKSELRRLLYILNTEVESSSAPNWVP